MPEPAVVGSTPPRKSCSFDGCAIAQACRWSRSRRPHQDGMDGSQAVTGPACDLARAKIAKLGQGGLEAELLCVVVCVEDVVLSCV